MDMSLDHLASVMREKTIIINTSIGSLVDSVDDMMAGKPQKNVDGIF